MVDASVVDALVVEVLEVEILAAFNTFPRPFFLYTIFAAGLFLRLSL